MRLSLQSIFGTWQTDSSFRWNVCYILTSNWSFFNNLSLATKYTHSEQVHFMNLYEYFLDKKKRFGEKKLFMPDHIHPSINVTMYFYLLATNLILNFISNSSFRYFVFIKNGFVFFLWLKIYAQGIWDPFESAQAFHGRAF
jgi:hypothetical protein